MLTSQSQFSFFTRPALTLKEEEHLSVVKDDLGLPLADVGEGSHPGAATSWFYYGMVKAYDVELEETVVGSAGDCI